MFWIAFFIALGSIWGAKLGGPRGVLELTFGPLFGSWGHLGAKMAPRPLQEASGIDFGSILDRFWIDFGPILDQFWMIFGPILDDFPMILGMFLIILDINPIRQ